MLVKLCCYIYYVLNFVKENDKNCSHFCLIFALRLDLSFGLLLILQCEPLHCKILGTPMAIKNIHLYDVPSLQHGIRPTW